MKKILILLFILILTIQSYTIEKFKLGDKINLKITNTTEQEIKKSFENISNIEIESIVKDEKGYIIQLRVFELGKKKVEIDDKAIEFEIITNLNEKDKDIYMDLSDNSNKNMFKLNFPFVPLLALIGFMVGLYFLIKSKNKNKNLSSSEYFLKGMKSLDKEKWSYEISYYLRNYIDSIYKSNFRSGKYEKIGIVGSNEITFLKKLDNYKFSNRNSENEFSEKESLIKKTYEIFEEINNSLKEEKKNQKELKKNEVKRDV